MVCTTYDDLHDVYFTNLNQFNSKNFPKLPLVI